MKRIKIASVCTAVALALVGCTPNTDNNGSYEEADFNVNFSATSLTTLPEGMTFGILSTCTRNGKEKTSMSEAMVAKFESVEEGTTVRLVPLTDSDKVIKAGDDHNFFFVGVSPYPENVSSVEAIPVSVPAIQNYDSGLAAIAPMIASARPSNVVPTIDLSFSSLFSILEFSIPFDPVFEDEGCTLKSMKFRSADKSIPLTVSGSINALTEEFTPAADEEGKEVCVDFGTGFQVPADGAKVQMLVAPFTVPEGGMEVEFEDLSGVTSVMSVLSSDVNTRVAAGESLAVQVSRIDDGIVPVTFPLYFPIGYPQDKIEDGKSTDIGYCNAANQPMWRGKNTGKTATEDGIYITNLDPAKGVFTSVFQPQATCKWHWVNEPDAYHAPGASYNAFIEFAGGNSGSTTLISSVGVKGIWTGDYFEFDIPVKKFKGGTKMQFTFAVCNKNAPTFWEVKYLDGEEWKTTATEDCVAPDGVTKAKATWAITYNESAKMSTIMEFSNPVASGHIYVRLVCVDGSIITTGTETVAVREYPYGETSCSANFYVVEKDAASNVGKSKDAWNTGKQDQTQSISFTIL